jgi:hypothetical protein
VKRAVTAARAFGVMLGGSVAVLAGAGLSLVRTGAALRRGRRPPGAALAGALGVTLYALAARPWMLRWGASDEDRARALPGDELASGPGPTRAVSIDAPVDKVWPWLAQIGQDRGGFYSYEWLENLAGCRMRNADRIHPDWQHRDVGERVYLHPELGLEVARFEPPHALVLEGWGAFVVAPIDARRTRLLARGRRPPGWAERVYNVLLMELPHFVMERRMLLGIKERAERHAARA